MKSVIQGLIVEKLDSLDGYVYIDISGRVCHNGIKQQNFNSCIESVKNRIK
jgi:hypothetical protein